MIAKTLQSKSARWLRLLVFLAAFVSVTGQAFESGHVHFDSQPLDCWVFHSSATAVDTTSSNSTQLQWQSVFYADDYCLLLSLYAEYLPPATGPPPEPLIKSNGYRIY
jgi:hypothetical protein